MKCQALIPQKNKDNILKSHIIHLYLNIQHLKEVQFCPDNKHLIITVLLFSRFFIHNTSQS